VTDRMGRVLVAYEILADALSRSWTTRSRVLRGLSMSDNWLAAALLVGFFGLFFLASYAVTLL